MSVCVCVYDLCVTALTISMSVDGTLIEAHDVLRERAGFIAEYVLDLNKSIHTQTLESHTTIAVKKKKKYILRHVELL